MAKAKSTPKPPAGDVLQTPLKKTASKAVWSGFLSAFGIMTIPVKAYKATDEDGIERNMFHSATCVNRLEYSAMKCTGCNQEVVYGQAVKGISINGKVVLVSDEEMAAQKPASTDTLTVTEFVPAESIDVTYYQSSEFIASGDGGAVPFATFREGLVLSGRVAIGKMVSRGHEYYVAIRPFGQHGMVMSYLFAEYEVRNCDKWATDVQVKASDAQVLAGLMNETEYARNKFTPAPYDAFLKNVRSMIAKKAAGETVETPQPQEAPKAAPDMMSALEQMLKSAKSKGKAVGK